MSEHYSFINLLIPDQIPILVGRLVTDYDYSIEKLGSTISLTSQDMPNTLLSIKVLSKKDLAYSDVLKDIKECLQSLKISYLSIIVTNCYGGCSWNVGQNFNPPKKKVVPKPSYLKLVSDNSSDPNDIKDK